MFMDKRLAILGLLALSSVLCFAKDSSDDGKWPTWWPHRHHSTTVLPSSSSSPVAPTPTPSSNTTVVPSSASHASNKTVVPTPTSTANSSGSKTTVVPTPPSTTHSSGNKTTVVPTPPSTTHSSGGKTTVVPTPASTTHSKITPTPSPAKQTVPHYTLPDAKTGNNCIVMNASMEFIVGYNTTSKASKNKAVFNYKYLHIQLVNATVDNSSSYCNNSIGNGNWEALLQLKWMYNKKECHVNFTFYASTNSGSQQWNLSTTTVHIPSDLFNKSIAVHPINGTLLEGKSYEVMDMKLDYKQSYLCNSTRNATTDVTNTSSVADYYNMTMTVSQFQVQAFRFNEPEIKYGFDQSASCAADSQDNKIVPIAVGAALAGLVIIVLIAYIIGRLRSRKQSSYEALS